MRPFPGTGRLVLVVILVAIGVLGSLSGAAAQSVTKVRVIEVAGPLDRPLLAFLEDRLTEAERADATVILQLDTPGTMGQDGIALAERVATLEVPVITWVGPAPATASGAGLLLLLASSAAAVSPGAQTGPLLPIDVLRPTSPPEGLEDTIRGWLAERGRDADLAAARRPIAARAAIDAGLAEVAAYTVPELLRELDGRTVRTPSGDVVLRSRVATTEEEAAERTVELRFEEPGLAGRILHAVGTPSMVYFLLVLGLAALAFELTQPGFGFAGFSGMALVILAAYGATIAVPSVPWLSLLVVGIVLLMVDVRLRSLSWPTGVGLAAFSVGSAFAWGDVDPAIRVSPWLIGGAVVASLLYYGFALTVALQSRDRIVDVQRGLVGLVGEARGRLAPEGPVFVKGAMWRGRSVGGPIEPGTPVRVRGVDGLILRVEPEAVEIIGSVGT